MVSKRFKIHRAPVFVFFQVILEVLISDIVWLIIIFFSRFEDRLPLAENLTFSEGFFLLFLIFQISMMSYIFLRWIQDYYWIEGNVLFHHRGIIVSRIDEYDLVNTESIRMKQGVIGRMFDYGHICINYPKKVVTLRFVPHPEAFLEMLSLRKKDDSSPILHNPAL